MTYSIVALDRATGHFGVAAATFHLAVGSLVPHARAGIGALATQATTNPYYGPRGLELLAAGAPAETVVRRLIEADEGRDHRQVHVVDRQGRAAAWTGPATGAHNDEVYGELLGLAPERLAELRASGVI